MVRKRLDESAGLAYRNLRDRGLVRRINTLLADVGALIRSAQSMEQALHDRSDEEWGAVDEHMERLQVDAESCSGYAENLHLAAQQRNHPEALAQMDKLEAAVHNVADELTRWKATAA